MKNTILILLLLLLFTSNSYVFRSNVIHVSDGDTITVMHDGKKEKICLYGINTPEIKQSFGKEARQSKSGLWSQDNPVAPWMYRRTSK